MMNALRRGLVAGITVAALVFGLGIYPAAVTMAQTALTTAPVAEAPGSVSLVPLFNGLLPYAVELFMVAIVTLAGMAVAFAKKKWGIDGEASLKLIESKYRDALHSAIYTGVAGVIAKGGLQDHLQINVGSEELASVLRHVRNSVPDAIEFFHPSEQVIAKLATAKAVELQAKAAPATLGAFTPARPDLS